MFSEEYWKYAKARCALKLNSEAQVRGMLGVNQKTVCDRLVNKARSVGKKFYISSNLTQCVWLEIMNNPNFEVSDWSVELKMPGNLDAGWNYRICGYWYTYDKAYRSIEKERLLNCNYPFVCNTTYDCKYAKVCISPLADMQLNCNESMEWKGKTPFLSRTVNGVRVTKKARVKEGYKYEWYD